MAESSVVNLRPVDGSDPMDPSKPLVPVDESKVLATKLRNEETLRALGQKLRDRFTVYVSDRRATECQWMQNLRQYRGVYDPTQALDVDMSRAYPKMTRVKVVSLVSRLMSLLFPADEENWGLSPSPVPSLNEEQLQAMLVEWAKEAPDQEVTQQALDLFLSKYSAKRTARMEQIITDQLRDTADYGPCEYSVLVRKVMYSAVLYSMGVLKGPSTLATSESRVIAGPAGPTIDTQQRYRPYFEFVPVWDYYPDMSAKTFDQMDGQFHRHVFSKHQLLQLAKRQDFDGEAIKKYVAANPDGNYTRLTYESDMQTLAGTSEKVLGKKYEVLEWWGFVTGDDVRAAGATIEDSQLSDEIRATVWVLDKDVIKGARDPYPEGAKMYHQFIFEDDEVNLCGSGLPPIMRDSQMAVATASRMLMDNAAVCCGPQVEVDDRLLDPNQEKKIKPFQVWEKDADAPANSGPAVRELKFDAHMQPLLAVISTFKAFADEETFVGPLTGGDMSGTPSEPLRTASGASMLMGNAALPFRDVVRSFDSFTTSVIFALVKWNELFNTSEDIFGDVRPVPRGSTSLIAKELRAYALDNLANTMTEQEQLYIDMKALAKHRLLVRDLPLNELMVTDEEATRREQQRDAAASEQTQLQNTLLQSQIAQVNADTFKATTQAQKNLDAGQVQVFNAVANAIEKGIDVNVIVAAIEGSTPRALPDPADPGGPAGDQLLAGTTGA